MPLHEVFEESRGEVFYILFGTQDVVGQRMTAEYFFFEVVVDDFGWGVFVEVDFFDDYVFLVFDFVEGEGGVEEDVGKEFEAPLKMFGEGCGVDAGLLFGGEGIKFASDSVDAVAYMVGTPMFGAFEDRVFDEMGGTFLVAYFVAGAYVDVDACVGDDGVALTKDDSYAVGKGVVVIHFLLFVGGLVFGGLARR